MVRSTRQAMLAQLWMAEGLEAVLDVLSRSASAREHDVIHELHAQAQECERTAPVVAQQLDHVAGQLAEIHAALRAAETVDSLAAWVRWQAQGSWRQSAGLQRLLAAVAASNEPATWPWRLERLPILQAELDRSLATAQGGAASAEPVRGQTLEIGPVEVGSVEVGPVASGRPELAPLAELLELWYRLDPALDRTCEALVHDVVAGQRSLADALRTVMAGSDEPEISVWRRACLLFHLLEQSAPSMRRAALVACTRLVASPEVQTLDAGTRATLVQRWAVALELHWRVLPDPPVAFEGALRLLDHVGAALPHGAVARVVHELRVVRTRLLRRLVGWRDGLLEEAVQAHRGLLDALDASAPAGLRGRVLGELGGLRRAARGEESEARDREVRALYDEALGELRHAVVMRARVLCDYAVYLAQPLRPVAGDGERALALAEQAVVLLEALPAPARDHPLVRMEEAAHRLTLGNLRLETGLDPLSERQTQANEDYARALERLGDRDDVLAGLVHLNLACVALAAAPHRDRHEQRLRARAELERALQGLGALPVAHARAIAERAMLAVRAAPEDEWVRERSIREVEAALHGLPLGVDRVVRARVQRQLGELHLHRDRPEDVTRAAECFAAARSAFVEGGAVRLSVEAARDYAEAQLRHHADDGDPAALIRAAVVLEQSALLAELRWATRYSGDSLDELTAMLDGVHGDLAWLLAKLGRPAEVVLHAVTRAKRYRANPSLRVLQIRAERSSMVSPAHIDPLARRSVPQPLTRRAAPPGMSAKRLHARMLEFAAANPSALALDLTLTRWGTVAVAVSAEGVEYTTVPLSKETVRRWVWGGWWSHYLGYRDALAAGHAAQAEASELAWSEAARALSLDLGARLLDPVMLGLGRSLAGRVVLLAPGRFSGLPFAAARMDGEALVSHVKGLAQIASLAELPTGPLLDSRPQQALCVLADPVSDAVTDASVDELGDVVRLLGSGQAEVEVLVRVGSEVGPNVYQPAQARTRERTVVSEESPDLGAVLRRVPGIGHLFVGGHGGDGLMLLDAAGRAERLDEARLIEGPRWPPGSSVLLSMVARHPPPTDDAAVWSLVRALHDAGVELVILAIHAVPPTLGRELSRGLYLYWALGRGLLEAFTAALANLAGADPPHLGAFVASLRARSSEPSEPSEPK